MTARFRSGRFIAPQPTASPTLPPFCILVRLDYFAAFRRGAELALL
jgi:hypothetical protein